MLVIADGAAFGPEMEKVMKLIKIQDNITLYLPESFEWIILKAGIIQDGDIQQILSEPWKYIESKEYLSWERFFTWLLVEKTEETILTKHF